MHGIHSTKYTNLLSLSIKKTILSKQPSVNGKWAMRSKVTSSKIYTGAGNSCNSPYGTYIDTFLA